jgi:hypothetical protein
MRALATQAGMERFITGVSLESSLGIACMDARAANSINHWIYAVGRTDTMLNGMACTLSALVLCGRQAHVVHVSDSRIWSDRRYGLTTCSRPSSLRSFNELVFCLASRMT